MAIEGRRMDKDLIAESRAFRAAAQRKANAQWRGDALQAAGPITPAKRDKMQAMMQAKMQARATERAHVLRQAKLSRFIGKLGYEWASASGLGSVSDPRPGPGSGPAFDPSPVPDHRSSGPGPALGAALSSGRGLASDPGSCPGSGPVSDPGPVSSPDPVPSSGATSFGSGSAPGTGSGLDSGPSSVRGSALGSGPISGYGSGPDHIRDPEPVASSSGPSTTSLGSISARLRTLCAELQRLRLGPVRIAAHNKAKALQEARLTKKRDAEEVRQMKKLNAVFDAGTFHAQLFSPARSALMSEIRSRLPGSRASDLSMTTFYDKGNAHQEPHLTDQF